MGYGIDMGRPFINKHKSCKTFKVRFTENKIIHIYLQGNSYNSFLISLSNNETFGMIVSLGC